MQPFYIQNIYPGPSSQTTSVPVQEFGPIANVTLTFFDARALVIEAPRERSWARIANDVLQEHAELWQRLAEL